MKILNYRRSRNVKMADLPEPLRIKMTRNGVQFQAQLPEDNRAEDRFVQIIEKGVYDNTKGLYVLEFESDEHFDENTDEYHTRVDFNIRFEDHDDLVSFERNFMIMHKLSN